MLCWHVESVAGSTDSLKPHALRVPSCRRAGLDRIRSASSEGTCASQAKKAKGGVRGCHTSDSEVLSKRKIDREGFRRKPDTCLFPSGVKAVKGDSPEGIEAQRRPLTAEGREPLSFLLIHYKLTGIRRSGMQQPQLTTYAEICEVRTVSGTATCNQLLAEGWVPLGVYPLTSVAEMTAREAGDEGKQKQRQDIQRYVRRFVGYVVGKRRES